MDEFAAKKKKMAHLRRKLRWLNGLTAPFTSDCEATSSPTVLPSDDKDKNQPLRCFAECADFLTKMPYRPPCGYP
jgi:hypothetical protein